MEDKVALNELLPCLAARIPAGERTQHLDALHRRLGLSFVFPVERRDVGKHRIWHGLALVSQVPGRLLLFHKGLTGTTQ